MDLLTRSWIHTSPSIANESVPASNRYMEKAEQEALKIKDDGWIAVTLWHLKILP